MKRRRAALIAGGVLGLGVILSFRSGLLSSGPADARDRPIHSATAVPSAAAGEAGARPRFSAPAAATSVNPVARIERKRIDAFTDWLGAWRRGGAEERGAILARGVELARARRAALRELIALDPAAALGQAVPRTLRSELPPDVVAQLEEPVDASGSLQVMAVCSERGTMTRRFAMIAERRYEVFTHGRRLESLSKERVPLHGMAIDGRLALAEQPCRRLEDPERADQGLAAGTIAVAVGEQVRSFSSPEALADWVEATLAAEAVPGPAPAIPMDAAAVESSWVFGEKSVLWVRAEFSDDPGIPATDEEIAAAMVTVNAYYDAVSRGRTSFKATVLPGTLPSSKAKLALTNGDSGTLYDEMKRLAKAYDTANGGTGRFDPDRYDRWMLVFKSVPAFDWGGLGWIGESGVWLNGGASAYVAIHELGHNQGLWHSHAWKPTTTSPISPGEHVEYGDYFDEMGGSGHFNTRQKLNLQYLDQAETQKAAAGGALYRIYRHDHRQASGVQAVVVDAGTAYDYWLEYRWAAPNDYFHHLDQLRGGITLRWGKRPAFTSGDGTYLLDMTPLSADDMQDAPLVLGESFTDPEYGITIVPVENGGVEPNQWIDVRVSYGATGSNHDPILEDVAHGTPVQARTDVSFAATGTDPDGDTLYYRWDFGDERPGPTSATVKHRWLVGGDYEVKVRAVDGRGGIANRTVNITVADPLTSWTRRAEGLTLNALNDVVWTGREFVAVGNDIVLSSDGVTWAKASGLPGGTYLYGVTAASSGYVAVGMRWENEAWMGAVLFSSDGLSWQLATLPGGAGPLNKVAFGAGRFVAVGRSGQAYGSVDGATWTECSTGVTESLQAIRFAEGLFVAAGDKGTIISSPDGLTWTNHTPANATASFRGIARLDGLWYVSAGYEMWSSADAATWERASWNGGWSINSLDLGFGVMLSTRSEGKIYVSSGNDTRVELAPEPGQTRAYNATAEGNGTVVMVGEQGVILQAGVPSLVAPRFTASAELTSAAAGRPVAVPVASSGYAKLQLLVDGAVVQEVSGAASTFSWTPPSFGSHQIAVRGTTASGSTMTSQPLLVNAALANWEWVNPRPFGGELRGAVEVDGQWWLVGGRDTLLRLDRDGTITRSEFGFANSPKSIAHDGRRFIVVGSSYDVTGERVPAIITSTDGVHWAAVPLSDPGASFFRVVFNGATGTWAALSSQAVWLSADGLTWTRHETGTNGSLFSLAAAGGRWVAVGSSGSIVTSTDGVTWAAQNWGAEWLVDVAAAGGRWVVVGGNGVILSSTDGVSWAAGKSGTTSWFDGVAATGAGFVAVAYGEIFSSADGVSWSKLDGSYWDLSFNGITAAADETIAFGSSGRLLRSADGVTWTRPNQGSARKYEKVIYAGGKYVAACDPYDYSTNKSGPAIETSVDGRTWTAASCNAYHLGDVSHGSGTYVAVGRAGIYTSVDGQSWTQRSSGVADELRTVASGTAVHVVAGANGCILTSPDGVTWTKTASPVNSRWYRAAYGKPGFVLVGEGGAIATSADGFTWTARASGVTAQLNGATWRDGVGFVAVGEQGTLLVSGDGVTWSRRDTGTTTELIDVTATALGVAVVGSYGDQMWVSADGSAWTACRLPASCQLRTIAVGPQGWVIAGYNGIMLWHPSTAAVVSGPLFARQPTSQTAAVGGSVTLSAALAEGASGSLQWQRSGVNVTGATTGTLTVADVQPEQAGLYALVASGAEALSTSTPAIVGVSSAAKVVGKGQEVGADIRHPNGNVFDQVLLTGGAEAITADHSSKQITRTSFIDLDGDIVQVEFAGPGTLSLVLDQASGPAEPVNYHQPGVTYMKGHAGIIITGADETTHLSVFTVGRATANDPTGAYNILRAPDPLTNDPAKNGSPLFVGHEATVYDGIADLAFVAISSTNGRFGGVRTANANYFAARGFTGIYAPGVTFTGPVFVGNISAFDEAQPVLVLGSASDVRVTGGDMLQDNGQPVQVSGVTQLKFAPGSDSHGHTFAAQPNRGIYRENGADVTTAIVVNP